MMRKIVSFLVLLVIVVQIYTPIEGMAITLGEYEQKLADYKRQAQENQDALNLTQSEITAANKQIANLQSEMVALIEEVKELNREIEDYNGKIKDKLMQSKQIIEYMQLSSGENVYLEYVFKADSTSDLIYRTAVVKELIDYNNRTIDEMEQIIKDNEDREKEIEKRKIEINKKESELSNKVQQLGEKKESLNNFGVTTSEQIATYEKLVKSYKDLGCESNDVIGVDCAVAGSVSVFRRPTRTGYITQEAYYSSSYTHRAVDVGSYNRENERIYPVADGKVVAKYIDRYGALVIALEHYVATNDTWYTSLYAHLSSYAPGISIGDYVTSDQYLGYMGDTGYSFGVHLHLEIFPCRLNNFDDPNCYDLNSFIAYGTQLLKNGYKGPRGLIYFPTGTYNSWNSR